MELNHLLVPCRDKVASAKYFARLMGLETGPVGHFAAVQHFVRPRRLALSSGDRRAGGGDAGAALPRPPSRARSRLSGRRDGR